MINNLHYDVDYRILPLTLPLPLLYRILPLPYRILLLPYPTLASCREARVGQNPIMMLIILLLGE